MFTLNQEEKRVLVKQLEGSPLKGKLEQWAAESLRALPFVADRETMAIMQGRCQVLLYLVELNEEEIIDG